MRLTIQNFSKVCKPLNDLTLNTKLFDFGDWFFDDADAIEDAYFILFQNKQKSRPYIEVSLNRDKVDGYGYHLETKLWYSANNWQSVGELFLEPSDISNTDKFLDIISDSIKAIKI
jgi:hypothetical protein